MSLVEFAGVTVALFIAYLRASRRITRLVMLLVWTVYTLFAFGVRL